MSLQPGDKVPATFKGNGEHLLVFSDNHQGADGKPYQYSVRDVDTGLQNLGIVPGAPPLMIYAHEAYGHTEWHDPKHNAPSIYVGIGRVCLPEHAGKTWEELETLGYQFHEPRSDFEPLYPLEHWDTAPVEVAVTPPPAPVASVNNAQALPVIPPTPPVQGEQ